MNLHPVLTDIWFYTTLLLLTGYIILGVLVLYAFRKVAPMLKTKDTATPVHSTLRQRLQNEQAHN